MPSMAILVNKTPASPQAKAINGRGAASSPSTTTATPFAPRDAVLEVAQGLHNKKKGKGKPSKGKTQKAKSKPALAADPFGKYTTQGTLFGDDPATQGELF